jgi:peptide deformylase
MILPIVAYGSPVLRKKAEDVATGTDIKAFVEDLFETMYHAQGVGIAAPQVGKSLRVFVIDAGQMDEKNYAGLKKVFINPVIHERFGKMTHFEEGCLSIPGVKGDVVRENDIRISYYDENWNFRENEIFSDIPARIIQHEYDHIEGVLFTDLLSGIKKQLIKGKLQQILKGKARTSYRMTLQ